jgi:F-type H+-transporting ATPase subunit gamma
MPSLIDLRRRIRAVKNTQQITKAMKMVAASKLRRAQARIMSARPYAQQMQRVLASVASRVDPSIHPLLTARERRPDSKALVIVVTGDKGLCGSFNTNVIKGAAGYIAGSAEPCSLGLVGRKGRDFFGRRGFSVLFDQVGIFQKLRFDDAQAIARTAIDAFVAGQVDRVVPLLPTRLITCTSRRPRRSSISCCRAISRRRFTGLSSNRTPRSLPRR